MKNPLPLTRRAAVLAAALLAVALAAPAHAAAAPTLQPASVKKGSPTISARVVGGEPASETYSFLTYVGGCTGSLIKSTWVVTARHCPTPLTVRVGSKDSTSGGTVANVSKAVNHPSIDVKLLQLSSSVSHAPVPIAATSGAVGTATRIIGWGLTCPTRGCAANPTIAHELDTSIIDDSKCSGINGTYEICTDNPNSKGACYGDSGGPQVKKVSGKWELIGATSRAGDGGATCAVAPSIYSDLPAIRSWITQQVGTLPSS